MELRGSMQMLPSRQLVKHRRPSMVVTRGLIIPCSAKTVDYSWLRQNWGKYIAQWTVWLTLTCLQHALGTLLAETSCGLFMFLWIINEGGKKAANSPRKRWCFCAWCMKNERLSDPSHDLQVYPSFPTCRFTETLWSVCCPPSWEAKDVSSPCSLPF